MTINRSGAIPFPEVIAIVCWTADLPALLGPLDSTGLGEDIDEVLLLV